MLIKYKEKLRSQIEDAYGKAFYTYVAHWEMVDQLVVKSQIIKNIQNILLSISTVGFITDVITNRMILTLVAGITAAISLALNLYSNDRKLEEEIQQHKKTANDLWKINEESRNLLIDFEIMQDEEIRDKRHELQLKLLQVYKISPTINDKAYRKARKKIKEYKYESFSSEEIKEMMPRDYK